MSTPPISGLARNRSIPKQRAMVAISTMTSVSRARKPLFCSKRIIRTSTAVIMTPYNIGMLNRSFSAMAEPMTSAKSVAAMASSHRAQSIMTTGILNRSRQAWARSRPVTIPSLPARDCNTTAIRFEIKITDNSV
ncbi:hypothetical protein D3C76_1438940 [compost metagenome]